MKNDLRNATGLRPQESRRATSLYYSALPPAVCDKKCRDSLKKMEKIVPQPGKATAAVRTGLGKQALHLLPQDADNFGFGDGRTPCARLSKENEGCGGTSRAIIVIISIRTFFEGKLLADIEF
jgi:hypothetical protein